MVVGCPACNQQVPQGEMNAHMQTCAKARAALGPRPMQPKTTKAAGASPKRSSDACTGSGCSSGGCSSGGCSSGGCGNGGCSDGSCSGGYSGGSCSGSGSGDSGGGPSTRENGGDDAPAAGSCSTGGCSSAGTSGGGAGGGGAAGSCGGGGRPGPGGAPLSLEVGPANADGLVPCNSCGRCFSQDRIAKHMWICCKLEHGPPRRQMAHSNTYCSTAPQLAARGGDTSTKRTSTGPGDRSADGHGHGSGKWKAESEAFRAAMRAARAGGSSGSTGGPRTGGGGGGCGSGGGGAPKSNGRQQQSDGRLACPHCTRTFAPIPWERHVKACPNIINKPKPLPTASPASPSSPASPGALASPASPALPTPPASPPAALRAGGARGAVQPAQPRSNARGNLRRQVEPPLRAPPAGKLKRLETTVAHQQAEIKQLRAEAREVQLEALVQQQEAEIARLKQQIAGGLGAVQDPALRGSKSAAEIWPHATSEKASLAPQLPVHSPMGDIVYAGGGAGAESPVAGSGSSAVAALRRGGTVNPGRPTSSDPTSRPLPRTGGFPSR